MVGILVQLAISWLVIWFYEKGNLSFLGFYPTKRRLLDFLLFFFLTAFCCSTGFLLRMILGGEVWVLNANVNFSMILEGIWWNIKSVLFEELIFRGILFYILLKKLGSLRAILISSVAFGVYHWFSQELFGDITQMIIVFFLTGIMGMLLAYGYFKTLSFYVPCAIHLGWNLTQGFIFSQGSTGNGVLIPSADQTELTVSYLTYIIILCTPLLSAWILNYILLRKRKVQNLIQ
jgi:uncharacterized protein